MDLILAAKKNTKRAEGVFHKLSEELRVSLVKMCIEDAPEERAVDQLDMSIQLTANIRKEEILRDNMVLAVSENILMHYISIRRFILWNVVTLLMQLTGR